MRSALPLLAFIYGAYASNVLDLVPDTFDKTVFAGTPALVEFFAPWCGHCKTLAPIYEEVADVFATQKNKVLIAKVDADGEGRETGHKYGVTGFPTLKWFDGTDSEPESYSGARDFDSITQFITEKTGAKLKAKAPPATLQLDASNFNDIVLDKSKDVLVAFTASWCGHCKAMKPAYEQVSLDFLPESNCIVANFEADADKNVALAQKYEIQSFPTIKFFPKGNKEDPIVYDGGRTEDAFVEFLNEKCGTHRAVGGGLNALAGRLPDLDALATKFFSATGDARKAVYDEAVTAAAALGAQGQHYLKVMQKVANGSEAYLTKESARLKSILDKRSLSHAKLDEIKIKANILAQFAEQKVEEAKETVEQAAGDVKEKVEEKVAEAGEAAESATKKVKAEL